MRRRWDHGDVSLPPEPTAPVIATSATPSPAAPSPAASSPARRVDDEPLLPGRSADDSDAGWHEGSDSNDDRLRQDVPPHW